MPTVETTRAPEDLGVEPLSDSEIVCWNLEFPDLDPVERIATVQQRLGNWVIAANSGGPTSLVLAKAISEAEPRIRSVNVRSHHETLKTLWIIDRYAEEFGLDLRRYDAKPLPIPLFGSPAFTEFQEEVKRKPFQRALEDAQAIAFFSGRMRWQMPGREELPFVERKGSVTVVNPVVDISEETAEDIFDVAGWERDENYFDPTKGPDQKTECGLNTADYKLHEREEI